MSTTQDYIATEVRAELGRQFKRPFEVAAALGVSRQSVYWKLRGTWRFSAEEIVTLAQWLNVPVANFLPDTVDVAS